MGLYPGPAIDQKTRLTKIDAVETFLKTEVEGRRKLHKKFKRVGNIGDYRKTGADAVGFALEITGISLLATGVGALPGFVLAGLGAGAFGVDFLCGRITRKYTTKAQKHDEILQIARAKLNSIHGVVSKALNDGVVSDEEFNIVLRKLEQYEALKEEIRSKVRMQTEEGTKNENEWLERGRQEARIAFAKYLSDFSQNVPAPSVTPLMTAHNA